MKTTMVFRPDTATVAAALLCLSLVALPAHAQRDTAAVPRLSVLAGIGMGSSRGTATYLSYFEDNGYWVNDYSSLFEGSSKAVTGGSGVLLAAEYLGWPRAAVGVAYASLGVLLGAEPRVLGSRYLSGGHYVTLLETHRSSGYYLYGAWYLTPVVQRSRRTVLRTALGVGMSRIRTSIVAGGNAYYYYEDDGPDPLPGGANEMLVSRDAFSVLGLFTAEWPLSDALWLGLDVEYRYTPDLRFDATTLHVSSSFGTPAEIDVTLPAHTINFSSVKFGLFLALRK
jgi:hypothetical protein